MGIRALALRASEELEMATPLPAPRLHGMTAQPLLLVPVLDLVLLLAFLHIQMSNDYRDVH